MFSVPDLSSYTDCLSDINNALADLSAELNKIPPLLSNIKSAGVQVVTTAAAEEAFEAATSGLVPPGKRQPRLIVTPELDGLTLEVLWGSLPEVLQFSAWKTVTDNVCDTPIPTVSGLCALIIAVNSILQDVVDNVVNWTMEQINTFVAGLMYVMEAIDDWWFDYQEGINLFLDSVEDAWFALNGTGKENTFFGKVVKNLFYPLMRQMEIVWKYIKKLMKVLEDAAILIIDTVFDIHDAIEKWSGIIRCLMRVDTAKEILGM